MKIIITGTTGMVGEGALRECLQNDKVAHVLSISRKSCNITHSKLKELIVLDFTRLSEYAASINGYDGCFYCAGISSVAMSEEKYRYITYDTTIVFAETVLKVNPDIAFCFISGNHTDNTKKGKVIWTRIKGKTEKYFAENEFPSGISFPPRGNVAFSRSEKRKTKLYVYRKTVASFYV